MNRAAENGTLTPYNAPLRRAINGGRPGTISAPARSQVPFPKETQVFRWAVILLIISLIAGGLGLTNISAFAKRVSMILFALFFLGFLALLGFAYLVGAAIDHSQLLPMIFSA